MASTLRGFGLEAGNANRIADVLAQTSAASNTNITGLGESMKYVAPVASGLGISVEQVSAMLGVMGNAGIKGSQAGTALRAAMTRLSKEPKAVNYTGIYNSGINSINMMSPISFRGMSKAEQYDSVFDYMAATIIDTQDMLHDCSSKPVGATMIASTINHLFREDKVFGKVPKVNLKKAYFPNGISSQTKNNIKQMLDNTRENTMQAWKELITENKKQEYRYAIGTDSRGADIRTTIYHKKSFDSNIFDKIKESPAIIFVIWNSLMADLSEENRHLPPPIDEKALEKTIEYYENLSASEYNSKAKGVRKFAQKYNSELINQTLNRIFSNENNEYSELKVYTKQGILLSKEELKSINPNAMDSMWVVIPSKKKDNKHRGRNAAILERLSYKNWCIRSRLDKAEAALLDGDCYVRIDKNREKDIWEPVLAMTMSKGKIAQIQGQQNDSFIPLIYIDEIKDFIKRNKLHCLTDFDRDASGAGMQIAIGEKLMQTYNGTKLYDAIKRNEKEIIEQLVIADLNKRDKQNPTEESYINLTNGLGEHGRVQLLDLGLTNHRLNQLFS